MKKNQKTRVVIVGGGFGGVKTAMELANKRNFEVTLISDTTNFEYHGALYRTATGHSPMEVVVPLRDIFKRAKNVEVILDRIDRINPNAKTLRNSDGHVYEYDSLVLALGNEINYFGLQDMEQKTFCMNTVSHTIALRHELISRFRSGQTTTIAVIGGGPSGVELAGELTNFAARVSDKYHKPMVKPNVLLIEGSDRLLPIFDPVLSARVYKRLKEIGVDIRLNTRVNSCEIGKVCLSTGDIEADVIVWTAGTRLPDFYQKNDVFEVEKGRIKVDSYLRAHKLKDIFIIGDNAATKYSGMAQTALYDAKYIAHNLIAANKKQKLAKYRPKKPVYVVPVGKNWAVLDSNKHHLSGYRAWIIRRRADLAILRNFEPYKKAIKQWRKGNQLANF